MTDTDTLSLSHCGHEKSDHSKKRNNKLKDKNISSLLSSLMDQRQEMIDLFKAKEEQEKKREQLLELRYLRIILLYVLSGILNSKSFVALQIEKN